MEQNKEDIQQAMEFLDNYKHFYGWREDEIQEALYRFVRYYKPNAGRSPSSFIKMCMDSVIKSAMRTKFSTKHQHDKIFLDKTFEDGADRTEIEYKAIEAHGEQFQPMEVEEAQQQRERLVESLLDTLTPKQRMVVEMRVYEELSFSDIGDKMGVSHQAVHDKWNTALKKMRNNKNK